MARPSHSIALLRVLIAAAWSDSRMSHSELNYIKELARRFDLEDDEWFALQPYLEDAPNEGEIQAIFDDLKGRVNSTADRETIVAHIQTVIQADDQISDDERAFLEQFEQLFHGQSSLDMLFGRIRGLLDSTPVNSTVDLDEFLRNKVLYKLRRKVGDDRITPEMHRLALLGGLMGIVAQADGQIDERELEIIRKQLERRGTFEEDTLPMLVAIIQEESVRGLDRHRLISEFCEEASGADRKELLDILFSVATADGALTHAELEELRSISSALRLGHRQYIDAKLRAAKPAG